MLGLVLAAALVAQTSGPDGGAPPVRGSADKEIIRRIIRRHIDDVKACYEPALAAKPLLAGRVLVKFTIGPSGHVSASELQASTMNEPRVEDCVVRAVIGWEFPKPLGEGTVIVSYPFVFTPAPIPLRGVAGAPGAIEIDYLQPTLLLHRSWDAKGVSSNGVFAVTSGGLLLVDTAWTEQQTEAILKWGEQKLGRRWIGAVITHDHGDRTGGLAVLRRRKIPVAALDLTVAKLARRGVRGVTTLLEAGAGAVDDPRGFEAFYPGPGHTSDNLVVAFKGQKVLFAGCVVKGLEAEDLGFTGDADLGAWPAAVRRIAERYPDLTVVPGHGVAGDSGEAVYRHTLDLLAAAAKKK